MRSNKILKTVILLSSLVAPLDDSDESSGEDDACSSTSSSTASSMCELESNCSDSSDEEDLMNQWWQIVGLAQTGLALAAAELFCRDGITYAIGPDRYSFNRIEALWATSAKCKDMFRFELQEMREMLPLLRFPATLRTPSGFAAPPEEAYCIMLRRLAYPSKWTDLCWEAGCSTSRLCEVFQAAVDHVFETFPHLRDSRSLEAWANHFEVFAAAIHAGGVNQHGCRRPCPLTNCVGFVDGSVQQVTRPSIFQRVLYNSHKKVHAVKWQGVMLANGIMPMPFGPINGVAALAHAALQACCCMLLHNHNHMHCRASP